MSFGKFCIDDCIWSFRASFRNGFKNYCYFYDETNLKVGSNNSATDQELKNIFRHIIATTIGTVILYLIFRLESYIWDLRNGDKEEFREYADFAISDFLFVGAFLLFGLCVQLFLVKPIFEWLTRVNKMTNKSLLISGLIFSSVTGLLVGLKLGSFELGLNDVLTSIGGSIVIFSIYYMTTFVIYKKMSD